MSHSRASFFAVLSDLKLVVGTIRSQDYISILTNELVHENDHGNIWLEQRFKVVSYTK